MQASSAVNGLAEQIDWHAINWQKAYRMLKNLRGRIFRAAKEGDIKKVRALQKLMLRSYANTVTSIRRVTQLNKGKINPREPTAAKNIRSSGMLMTLLFSA